MRSNTEQCILRDAKSGDGIYYPKAKSLLDKMKAKGLIKYRKLKDGRLKVRLNG